MFADDTNLFFKHKDLSTLYNIIDTELSKISQWFKLNKLSLNLKKTNFIVFHSKTKKSSTNNLDIYIDNIELEQDQKPNSWV